MKTDARRRGGKADASIANAARTNGGSGLFRPSFVHRRGEAGAAQTISIVLSMFAIVALMVYSGEDPAARVDKPALKARGTSRTADDAASNSLRIRDGAGTATPPVTLPKPAAASGADSKTTLTIYMSSRNCTGDFSVFETSKIGEGHESIKMPIVETDDPPGISMKISGPGGLRLYNKHGDYVSTAVELGGCNPLFPFPPLRDGRLFHRDVTETCTPQVAKDLQMKFATVNDLDEPHTRIVFSAESSEYMGFQVFANAFAFLNSTQTDSSWLRLLSSGEPDDLAAKVPTFTAPHSPYAKRYGPINKPDVIDKWFASKCDAPNPDDTIIVIDPDNFLLRDVSKWTEGVKRKYAVGEAAYYFEVPQVQELWKEVCEEGCDRRVDEVGVPYVVKAADLKEIAPLWRKYSKKIKELQEGNGTYDENYERYLHSSWAAEMFGYNFACAHLGIHTKIVRNMQARDVDPSLPLDSADPPGMIHTGRAWFPFEHKALAERWRHTEGDDFLNGRQRSVQVWCKCNQTASKIIPWPIPAGLDLQSYHTLRLLHDGLEYFGGVPENNKYRRDYFWSKN